MGCGFVLLADVASPLFHWRSKNCTIFVGHLVTLTTAAGDVAFSLISEPRQS